MNAPKWTKERVAQKLANLSLSEALAVETGRSELEWAYRQAAAVLAYFDPGQLRPFQYRGPGDSAALGKLLADSTLIYDEQHRARWRLRSDARREALERLGRRERLQAVLAANPSRPSGPLQQTIDAYINGTAPPLDTQALEGLANTLQVIDWFDGLLENLPDRAAVRRRLEAERLLEPFRYLVGDHFRGRERELQQLRDYVGVLPPGSVLEATKRFFQRVLSLHEKPPLLIFGPGGVGKSTLLARFILDHTTLTDAERFPVVYLDFDRPGLVAQEPVTLLVEVVRQIGVQYPHLSDWCDKTRQRWLAELTGASTGARRISKVQRSGRGAGARSDYIDEFRKILGDVGDQDQPFLLVLDTFEEVQYRSIDFVAELWDFLNALQAAIPRLRTVLAGRAVVREFDTENLELADLDREAAVGFLQSHGIEDQSLARLVVEQVGGNPLSLELAVEVLRKEGAGQRGLKDLGFWKLLQLRMQASGIQGHLYRRILDHIHDPTVRKLAHPGLVLRRITPELISQVLAGPCGVRVENQAHADRLFAELRREVSLVTPSEDGALRHRPDIRRVMLADLRRDKPDKVAQIHQNAIDYYKDQEGLVARAEEIYHRLALKPDMDRVDERWLAGVEQYLGGAIEELPPRAQRYLASRLGLEIAGLDWDESGVAEWERRAERRVRDLLSIQRLERALEVLAEREERSVGSPLYLLEAQVLDRLGRWEEARRVAKDGIYSAYQRHEQPPEVALLLLAARMDKRLGFSEQALEMLAQAEALLPPEEPANNPQRFEINALRLGLPGADPALLAHSRDAALKLAGQLSDSDLAEKPAALIDLIEQAGADEPWLVGRGLRILGLPLADEVQRDLLAGALDSLSREFSRQENMALTEQLQMMNVPPAEAPAQTWQEFTTQASPTELLQALERLVEKAPVTPQLVAALVKIWREQTTPDLNTEE